MNNRTYPNFSRIFNRSPKAYAKINGDEYNPNIKGEVYFYDTDYGVIVATEVVGLEKRSHTCSSPIFAFHIHDGNSCTGNMEEPFANSGMHFNPFNCPHPYHAGDLPPLFGAGGNAFMVVLTDRFKINDIIGRTIIIHSLPDDFTTQPSGNSGRKIACGEIIKF